MIGGGLWLAVVVVVGDGGGGRTKGYCMPVQVCTCRKTRVCPEAVLLNTKKLQNIVRHCDKENQQTN